jgi:hypothetical protein
LRKEVVAGVRDPGRVREQYEDYWSEVLAQARQIVEAEPRNLARALSLLIAAQAGRPRKVRWMRGRRVSALLAGRTLPGRLDPRLLNRISRAAITELVAAYGQADTKRIVELGSGWGANLFSLWLAGAPRAAEYVAMEYTAAGREATQLVGGTEPDLRLRVAPFDYHAPDLSALRTSDKTLVFTSFSIEQITHLSDALFEELLAIPGLDRVVHIEPVSWQLLAETSVGPLIGFLSYIVPPRLSFEVDLRRRSRSTGYNVDLLPKLRALERAGRIRIERIEKNYIGPNPLNPGTAIVWRRT